MFVFMFFVFFPSVHVHVLHVFSKLILLFFSFLCLSSTFFITIHQPKSRNQHTPTKIQNPKINIHQPKSNPETDLHTHKFEPTNPLISNLKTHWSPPSSRSHHSLELDFRITTHKPTTNLDQQNSQPTNPPSEYTTIYLHHLAKR